MILKSIATLVAAIDAGRPDQQTYEQLQARITMEWREPYIHGDRGGQEQSAAVREIAGFVLRQHEAMAVSHAKSAPTIHWRVAYFGNLQSSGHVLHGEWWSGKVQTFNVRGESRHLDQGFLPFNQRGRLEEQNEGVAWLTHTDEGLTVLSFWDRSGDPRGGSCSAFIIDGRVDFETAVMFSKAMWPSVWSRIMFPITYGGQL